jgi:hypothetical protein
MKAPSFTSQITLQGARIPPAFGIFFIQKMEDVAESDGVMIISKCYRHAETWARLFPNIEKCSTAIL